MKSVVFSTKNRLRIEENGIVNISRPNSGKEQQKHVGEIVHGNKEQGRLSGISLAWQRMGLSIDIADYIAACDNHNQIFPRTLHYLNSSRKKSCLAFHAAMGTPQGCSSASLSYLVVEDIILYLPFKRNYRSMNHT